MATDWKQIGAVKEVQELAYLMWDKNWDEANGGGRRARLHPWRRP